VGTATGYLRKIFAIPFLLLAYALFGSGCVTHALWEEGTFARFHEPAKKPRIKLYLARDQTDVLAVYMETRDDSDRVYPRAYWVAENAQRVAERNKPHFVRTSLTNSLQPILLLPAAGEADVPAEEAFYGVVASSGVGFSLVPPKTAAPATAGLAGSYELPFYEDASARTRQMLLTPPAVIIDATILGAVAFVILWAQSGGGWLH
jgi:hypothetical protein